MRRATSILNHAPTFCSVSAHSLVDEFTKFCYQRDLPRAMKAMEAMHRNRLSADAITYSELIKCCLVRGAVQQARLVHEHFDCCNQTEYVIGDFIRFGISNYLTAATANLVRPHWCVNTGYHYQEVRTVPQNR
ncbi:hypothetical protein Csa_004842 [Cucumis sativus]|nr:hypothetical protein Csa_004842 [Cucumis sativus]